MIKLRLSPYFCFPRSVETQQHASTGLNITENCRIPHVLRLSKCCLVNITQMTLLYTLCEPEAQLMRFVRQFRRMLLINRAGGNLLTVACMIVLCREPLRFCNATKRFVSLRVGVGCHHCKRCKIRLLTFYYHSALI
jgi:hypothetical protein